MKKEFIELYNELTNKKDNELLKIWEDSKKEKIKRKIVILVVLIIVDILVALRFSEAIRSVRDVFIVIATILFYDLIIGVIVNALIQSKTRKYNSVYKTKVVEKIIKTFLMRLIIFQKSLYLAKYMTKENMTKTIIDIIQMIMWMLN